MENILKTYKEFDKLTKLFVAGLYMEEKRKEELKNGKTLTKVPQTRNH